MGLILQSRHRLISSDSPNCRTQLQCSPGFLCEVGLSLVSNHSIGLAFITNLSNVKLLSWIVIWNGMPCHISLTNSNHDMRRKLQQSELIMPIECSHLCAALSADMRTRKHRDNCSTWSNSSGCEHFGAGNVHSRCSQTWLVYIDRDRTE